MLLASLMALHHINFTDKKKRKKGALEQVQGEIKLCRETLVSQIIHGLFQHTKEVNVQQR